ncbi:hypothetical protein HRR83_006898 [Exophiala dermatitidis]|uniref:Queuosine 5'-phosphate N-glycosylase/hydrolase n=1 Tax=Exophiala dermatitidis TaxID=5970 RepID=A0AAN6EQZ5_EXODE|nr:hypothetical protein HRR73_005937 [Exophiala dermatitidis]KAJ4512743.1 hypothetical protein HRR74_006441 [Exophiala dermatitidis]KAJ4542548.1 hypothetical protein HRR77_005746 [Exophiala dermatitidis]KAJ4548237.1 hypothetical protein HRR76_000844 [Exophiala dermatitidis]KAJ4570231.1 hypothetical protein HRR82_007440 [Exophiala dermatitidis]
MIIRYTTKYFTSSTNHWATVSIPSRFLRLSTCIFPQNRHFRPLSSSRHRRRRMSEDETDPELQALLRESLGLGPGSCKALPSSTGVLKSAEYICNNAIDVAISPDGTRAAAETIWQLMQKKHYSTETWSSHELHPQAKDENTVNFIFTMNLLNFSFWSELSPEERFAIDYRGRRWTGYWSLVAALQRALDEGYPITTPSFWHDRHSSPDSLLSHIFRSATAEPIPLLAERISILREAGDILCSDKFHGRPVTLISQAENSASRLVNLLAQTFPNFRDTTTFHGREVRLYKRAQILVADLWACFNGVSYGHFDDIGQLTMFADYRIPQMLQGLGCLLYSPRLESRVRRLQLLKPGEDMEVEIRGCSIWCVELLRRQIESRHPEAKGKINAVLIDFFLYDSCKEMESRSQSQSHHRTGGPPPPASGDIHGMLPHHRTRSIFY